MDLKLREHKSAIALDLDLESPRKCGHFIFGSLIGYLAFEQLCSLVLTISFNLIGIIMQFSVRGFQFSELLLAFSPTLSEGLQVFEQLRFLLSMAISSFFTIFFAMSLSGIKPRYVFPSKKLPALGAVCAFFICIGFSFAGSLAGQLVESLFGTFGIKFYDKLILPPVGDTAAMVMFFCALVIIPALFEEFLIRGIVISSLKRFGGMFAVILSSLLFGLMHGSITAMIQAVFFSLAAGFIVMRYENIWVTVAAHFTVNLLGFITNTLMQTNGSAFYADFINYLTAGALFALLICAVIVLLKYRHFLRRSGGATDKSAVRELVLSPASLCFYLICVINILFNTFIKG